MKRKSLSFGLTLLLVLLISWNPVNATTIVYNKTLNVPTYRQETNYWCGPASMQMVISFTKGNKIEQSTLAHQAGTTTSGTIVHKISETLNDHGVSVSFKTVTSSNIDSIVRTSLNANIPIVANVDTKYLPAYAGASLQHYVVVRGYYHSRPDEVSRVPTIEGATASQGIDLSEDSQLDAEVLSSVVRTIHYVDPYDGRSGVYGRKSCTLDQMLQAVVNRSGYVICR